MHRLTTGLTAGPMQRASYGRMQKESVNSNRGVNGVFFGRYDCGGSNTNGRQFLANSATPSVFEPTETLTLPPLSPTRDISPGGMSPRPSPASSFKSMSSARLPSAPRSQPFGTTTTLASIGVARTPSINYRRQQAFGRHIARCSSRGNMTPRGLVESDDGIGFLTSSMRADGWDSLDEANLAFPAIASALDFPSPEHVWPPRTPWSGSWGGQRSPARRTYALR